MVHLLLGGRFPEVLHALDKVDRFLAEAKVPGFISRIQPRSALNMPSIACLVAPPLRIAPCCIWKRESDNRFDLFERGGDNADTASRF